MNRQDDEAVKMARDQGAGVLHDVLTQDELEAAREDLDRAYLEIGQGPGRPGSRDSIWGEGLLQYSGIARLFSHPRISTVVGAIMGDEVPWVSKFKTNRYTPEHKGVGRHSDTPAGLLIPPFSEVSTQIFLDDIVIASGALTYAPETHFLHFESEDDPDRIAPTKEEIAEGEYVPIELNAGSVVFRIPQVWHAVNPIHHLRRYVTASYTSRDQVLCENERIAGVVEKRRQMAIDEIPDAVRPYWSVDL